MLVLPLWWPDCSSQNITEELLAALPRWLRLEEKVESVWFGFSWHLSLLLLLLLLQPLRQTSEDRIKFPIHLQSQFKASFASFPSKEALMYVRHVGTGSGTDLLLYLVFGSCRGGCCLPAMHCGSLKSLEPLLALVAASQPKKSPPSGKG